MALRRAKQIEEPVPTGPARVLVVNDEADACELLVRILRRAGKEVERAQDFDGLADRLCEHPPLDCIVLDVAAGGIGGNLKLLDAVRGFRDEAIAATPVVMVTMATNSAMFSWQSGVDELLVRPFHATDLVAAVESAVTRPADERPKHRRRQLDAARASGRQH